MKEIDAKAEADEGFRGRHTSCTPLPRLESTKKTGTLPPLLSARSPPSATRYFFHCATAEEDAVSTRFSTTISGLSYAGWILLDWIGLEVVGSDWNGFYWGWLDSVVGLGWAGQDRVGVG